MQTISVFYVLIVKLRINYVKRLFLPVNGENGSTAQGHKGVKGIMA